MIRIVHCSDIHFDRRRRLDDMRGVVDRIIDDAVANAVDVFVVTGDVCGVDTNHTFALEERIAVRDMLRRMASHAPVVAIRGNHDAMGELGFFHLSNEQITIADEEWRTFLVCGIRFVCVPYSTKRSLGIKAGTTAIADEGVDAGKKIVKIIRDNQGFLSEPAIALVHQPVMGVGLGEYEVASSQDAVLLPADIESLPYNYIAFGHIHAQQQITSNAWYAGSPVPLTFSEQGEKGYLLVEIDSGKTTVTPRHIKSWTMTTLDYTIGVDGAMPVLDGGDWHSHHVKVRLTVPAGVRFDDDRPFLHHFESQGAISCVVKWEREQVEKRGASPILQTENDSERLGRWLGEKGHEPPDRDRIVGEFEEMKNGASGA